jgi:hypothetical protein
MKALTSLERRALGLASSKAGVEVVSARKADGKQVTRAVANRMVLAGFAAVTDGRLRIMKAGQKALNALAPEDPPVYLRARDGLTTRRDLSVRDEAEIIDPATLESFWTTEATGRHEGAQCSRTRSRGISRSLREAA